MTGVSRPVTWRLGGVLDLIEETPHAKTIVLDVPVGPGTSPVSTSTYD